MERIKLTKNQKRVLRMVAQGQDVCPAEFPSHTFNASVRFLQQQGLMDATFDEGGSVEDSKLTNEGRQYLAENPGLCNPINWWRITILSMVAYLVAMIVWMIIK